MSDVKSRLLLYLKHQNISIRAFNTSIGVSNSYVQNMRTSMQPDKVERVAEVYPDLNIEWLLTGKGDMLIPEEDEMIRRGKELDEEDYHKAIAIGLPLIPEREVAFRGGDEGEINLSSPIIAYWHIPNTPKNSEIVTVYGNSMHPKIPSGSRIVVYPYFFNPNEPTTIEFGRIFAIVVEDGTTGEYKAFIKYLRRHPDKALERKYWIARSENREEYDDFEVEVSQVRRLFAVESIISTIR